MNKILVTSAKLIKNGNVCSIQHFCRVTDYELDYYFKEENKNSAISSIAHDLWGFIGCNSEYEAMDVVSALLRDKLSYFPEDVEDGSHAILFFVENDVASIELY